MRNRNKYNAKKVKIDGITFDSKFEAEYYSVLKLMEKAGHAREIDVHPEFLIHFNNIKFAK